MDTNISTRDSNRPFFRRMRKLYINTFNRKIRSLEKTLSNNELFYPGIEVFEELLEVVDTTIEYAEETNYGYIGLCKDEYEKIKEPKVYREEIIILLFLKELKTYLIWAKEKSNTLNHMECYNNYLGSHTPLTEKRKEYVKDLTKKTKNYFTKEKKLIRKSISEITKRMEIITLITGVIPKTSRKKGQKN